MISYYDNLRKLISLIFIVLSFYSISFYEGSKIIFLLFNFLVITLTYYLTNSTSSFFSFFLAFYFFMGYWFKYNFSLIYNNGYVFDSGMSNPPIKIDIDDVLVNIIFICLVIIFSTYISNKKFYYSKKLIKPKINFFTKVYFKYKYLILSLFTFTFLYVGLINFRFKLYVKGIFFENEINLLIISFIKWLILFGFVSMSCYFLNKESLNKNKKLLLIFLIVFLEIFISYTSMLSRAMVLFGLPFIYTFIFHEKQKNYFIKYSIIALLFVIFSFFSIIISNKERTLIINNMKKNIKMNYEEFKSGNNVSEKDNIKVEQNYIDSSKFNFQIDETKKEKLEKKTDTSQLNKTSLTENPGNISSPADAKHMSYFIIINRWVGIDSLINVSRSENLGFDLFFRAFEEKKSIYGNTFYEKNFGLSENKKNFYFQNTFMKGNTLPGLVSFLFYTGNLPFLFISIMLIIIFFNFVERKIYFLCDNNLYFVSFISHSIVYRLFSFGYAPADTYLFLISIILSVSVIYFLNISSFDKIFNNLKYTIK